MDTVRYTSTQNEGLIPIEEQRKEHTLLVHSAHLALLVHNSF